MGRIGGNKHVMEQAGLEPNKPPTTWEELRSMAKTVTEKGGGNVYGLTFGGAEEDDYRRIAVGLGTGTNPEALGNVDEALGFNFKTGEYGFATRAFSDAVKLRRCSHSPVLIYDEIFGSSNDVCTRASGLLHFRALADALHSRRGDEFRNGTDTFSERK